MNTSVQFIYLPASRLLVKPVNILSDNGGELSCLLQFGQFPVGRIRLRVQTEHPVLIKPVKFLRISQKKGVAYDCLRWIFILHIV